MKKLAHIYKAPPKHWVGDGFHVHTMFSYNDDAKLLSPFLLLDYAPPRHFEPNLSRQYHGVGEHPHRGFETVTIAYNGEVTHKDSFGGGGTILEGDVQWMTAGSGLMHQEYHSDNFSKQGGLFSMVQLWVNLPAKDKMTQPKYQAISTQQIPVVTFENNAGQARIIAGDFEGTKGTASTFTPINMWDITLNQDSQSIFELPDSHNLILLVLDGEIVINDETSVHATELANFAPGGSQIKVASHHTASKFLLLSGEPLNEPVVGYGPFVMNTQQEIVQAFQDVRQGKFGSIAQQ
ncbi:pirin family protein [Pelistega sp. MC2]|uniref:pirin family protein n=1 Tax=Pelistega sp. MC2 TaxID=1720297 RepID=UPI0008D9B7EB|nr:pirin family protein [Pelistega sp. MC2]